MGWRLWTGERETAMTTVLFIHSAGPQGRGEGSSALLEGLGAAMQDGPGLHAPLMPEPDNPDAEAWIAACQSEIAGISDDMVLVGHSLGGSIILQTLARFGQPANLVGVITLASPFWGAAGWDFESYAIPENGTEAVRQLPRLVMLQGEEDEVVAADHLDLYKALLPNADTRRLPGEDHAAAGAGPVLVRAIAEMTSNRA